MGAHLGPRPLGNTPYVPPPFPRDPFFNAVSLLLHGDGTNAAQNNTFIDSSTNNFTVTRNGNPTQGTNTPFSQAAGAWSNYIGGTLGFSVAGSSALNLNGVDFTIEFWFYPITQGPHVLINQGTNWNINYDATSGGRLYYQAGAQTAAPLTSGVSANRWHHVAVVKSGANTKMYVNGTAAAISTTDVPASDSTTATTISPAITYVNAYFSNFRIVKGTAVYTANFTPPTTPLTAITNTSLLTCQSNNFKDNSSNNFAVTATGTPSVQPFSPFAPTTAYSTSVNGGSMYFDGTGDYLTTPDSANYAAGTGDFTFECWLNLNSVSGTQAFFNYSSYVWGILMRTSGTSLDIYVVGTNVFVLSNFFTIGQWTHVVLVRTSGVLKVFKNGVQVGSDVSNTSNIIGTAGFTGVMIGGSYHTSGGENLNGYISSYRYVVGTAVYTTTFTPPTAPLTAITNTQLLLNGTNAGIFDNAAKNDLETVGNAQVSTSVKKYGTGSMSFDGTGDYFATQTSPLFTLGTENFTIECWVYFNSVSAGQIVICNYLTNQPFGWVLYTSAGNLIYYFGSTGNTWNISNGSSVGSISTGTWYHVALVRNGSTFTPYLNGVAGTPNTSSLAIYGTNQKIFAGGNGNEYFNGYIDDLRITKGVARYTANFTPPTEAFLDQ